MKKYYNTGGLCPDCGESLQIETCPTCHGKGEIKYLVFLKKTCPRCEGSGEGERYVCPDWHRHNTPLFRRSSLGDDSSFKKSSLINPPLKSMRKRCPAGHEYVGNSCPICAGGGYMAMQRQRQMQQQHMHHHMHGHMRR